MRSVTACFLLSITVLAGCGGPKHDFSPNQPNLGPEPAKMKILRSLQAMGGMQALTTHTYRASAVITQSGPGDSPMTWQVKVTIDPVEQTISASAPAGRGAWAASVTKGQSKFEALGGYRPTEQEKRSICRTLQTVLHRVTGPLNFYLTGEKAKEASKVSVDGETMDRIGVIEGAADIRAYYFAPNTHLIRYVTATADAPNRPGTVTVYQWRRVGGKMQFPKSLRVVSIGQNALIGSEEILSVEFLSVQSVEAKR